MREKKKHIDKVNKIKLCDSNANKICSIIREKERERKMCNQRSQFIFSIECDQGHST